MQKVVLTFIVFIASIFLANAQEKHTFSITVNVTGMKADKGDVYVALYNSKTSFLKKEFKGAIVNVSNKKATAVLEGIEEGVYAISVFHDKNDNKKMDTNFIGIPKEPIGCSNGATGFMGPPKFIKAKFTLNKNKTIPIKVQ